MIKFFGTPLKEITSKLTNKVVFRFDSKGEFTTDDPEIIKRAMGHFDHMPVKIESTGDKVKKVIEAEAMTIEVKEEEKIHIFGDKLAKARIDAIEGLVVPDYSNIAFNELRKIAKDKGIELKNPTKEELIRGLEVL